MFSTFEIFSWGLLPSLLPVHRLHESRSEQGDRGGEGGGDHQDIAAGQEQSGGGGGGRGDHQGVADQD